MRAADEENRRSTSKVAYLDSAMWHSLVKPEGHEEFFATWLTIQCGMIAGVKSGVLAVGDEVDGALRPVARFPPGPAVEPALAEAAELAVARKQGVVLKPEGAEAGTPIAAAYPVLSNDRLIAVCSLLLEQRSDAELQLALRRLQWGAAWIELDYNRRAIEDRAVVVERLGNVLDCVAAAGEQVSFRGGATAFVTEVALRLDAERVALGLTDARRVKVVALSHSSRFDRRMLLMRHIRDAMQESVDQRCMVQLPDGANDSPTAKIAHVALQRHSGNGWIVTVPFERGGEIIGAVSAEFSDAPTEDQEARAQDIEVLDASAMIAGPMLATVRSDERWLTTRAFRSSARHVKRLFGPRFLGRKLAVLVVLAAVLFFSLYTAPYRVVADVRLEGSVERIISAPDDGFIAEAAVRPGDVVSAGEPLARLDDFDLRLELHAWRSRLAQIEREHTEAVATRRRAEAGIALARIEETNAQIGLIQARLDRQVLTAPFDAVVIEGDFSQALGSAVQKGAAMFRLAPLDGYRAAIFIDERDISDLEVGLTGALVLSALPSQRFEIEVTRLTSVTRAQDGINAFRIEGLLGSDINSLRPGLEGVAKIDIGERRLVWIWSRRMVQWVRLSAWRWMP